MKKLLTLLLLIPLFGFMPDTKQYAKVYSIEAAEILNLQINNLMRDSISDYHASKWCEQKSNRCGTNEYLIEITRGNEAEKQMILRHITAEIVTINLSDTCWFVPQKDPFIH